MGEYTNVAKQLFLLTAADCQPVLVFLPCSHSAPDMALRFVQIQDHSGLGGKRWIDRDKSLRAVLMHCTLAYPKSFCSLAYRSVVIYNVISNGHSPFFNIIFQRKNPQNTFVQSMKVSEGLCIEIVSVLNHMRFGKFFSLLE